jgi:hypothetical protein
MSLHEWIPPCRVLREGQKIRVLVLDRVHLGVDSKTDIRYFLDPHFHIQHDKEYIPLRHYFNTDRRRYEQICRHVFNKICKGHWDIIFKRMMAIDNRSPDKFNVFCTEDRSIKEIFDNMSHSLKLKPLHQTLVPINAKLDDIIHFANDHKINLLPCPDRTLLKPFPVKH